MMNASWLTSQTKRLFVLFWLVGPVLLCAQQGSVLCSQLLTQAEDKYESGDLLPIPNMLSSCLANERFSREENVRAYKLVTLVHIFTDSVTLSENAMVRLLKEDPEHQFNEVTDPKEIFYLHRKFRTKPIYRISLDLIGNMNFVNNLETYGVENNLVNSERAQAGIFGGVGLGVERQLNRLFELTMAGRFSARSYSIVNELYAYSSYDLTETQYWVELPVTLRFFLAPGDNEWKPYVYVGWMEGYLLSSTLTGTRQGGAVVNLGNQNLASAGLRRRFNHSALGGIGLKIRRPSRKSFFVVNASYTYGINNLANEQNRYGAAQDIPFRLGYVDNNFSLSSVQLSVGYVMSVYNPKKLKRFR